MKLIILIVFLLSCCSVFSAGTYDKEDWEKLYMIQSTEYEGNDDCSEASMIKSNIEGFCLRSDGMGVKYGVKSESTLTESFYDGSITCGVTPETTEWPKDQCYDDTDEDGKYSFKYDRYKLTNYIALLTGFNGTDCSDPEKATDITVEHLKCYLDNESGTTLTFKLSLTDITVNFYKSEDCSGTIIASQTEEYDKCFNSEHWDQPIMAKLQYYTDSDSDSDDDTDETSGSTHLLYSLLLLFASFFVSFY
ncbi:hypothetical protein M0813_10158 [Anaeramoeba flamelloides]|uniref:Uncharacterized protein n=1 Tax=Anaeramoeba flamelloides TaxID=1746091 RepID=A0ABQ8X2Y4_9EUKA|nr:hypothetical protein M0813_10158 [Anaeramoeba flamelloides]